MELTAPLYFYNKEFYYPKSLINIFLYSYIVLLSLDLIGNRISVKSITNSNLNEQQDSIFINQS